MQYKEYTGQKTYVIEKFKGLLTTYPEIGKIVFTSDSKQEAYDRADKLHLLFLTDEQRENGNPSNHFRVSVNTLTQEGKRLFAVYNDPKFTAVNITQKSGFEGMGDMEDQWDETKEEREKSYVYQSQYITDLKEKGDYGRLYDTEISIEKDDSLDKIINYDNTSYSMQIVDFSASEKEIPAIRLFDSKESLDAWKNYKPNGYDK